MALGREDIPDAPWTWTAPMATAWEYRIVYLRLSEAEHLLNELGQTGWELLSVVECDTENARDTYYLKRPKQ